MKEKKRKERAKPRKPAAPARIRGLRVPAILLEGDAPASPPAPVASRPGQRFALAPTPPSPVAVPQPLSPVIAPALPTQTSAPPPPSQPIAPAAELPEAYGTQRLFLTARDPHWLYAHWDLTRDQRRDYNAKASGGRLALRVYKDRLEGAPYSEVALQPDAHNWFVNVGHAGATYLAELGYNQESQWTRIAVSGLTLTPPDTWSEDASAWFETLPDQLPVGELVQLVKGAASEHPPLREALQQLSAPGLENGRGPEIPGAGPWTPEQERALAELVRRDVSRRIWMGSLEITEVIRRQLRRELLPGGVGPGFLGGGEAPAHLGFAGAGEALVNPGLANGGISSLSQPGVGEEQRKGFWFNINAELVIYGATEPDAKVTIGGRVIMLRPDGSFSFRFALPDGTYPLPAIATSADGTDTRSAALSFTRQTDYRGHVEAHPQDPGLKRPAAENLE
jgi:hypothetical protein